MAKNSVAANLAMLVLVVGGLIYARSLKQEIFPEFDLDIINVTVPYPGAGPEEVEQGICFPIEEALSGIEGIEEVSCLASEGAGVVRATLLNSSDVDIVLQDIKSEVDRIRTLPEEAEEPTVSKVIPRHEVLSIAVYGDVSERTLRETAELIRDDLLELPQITQIELSAVAPYEISVEVSEYALQKYGLTLEQIAARIRESSIDIPGGVLKAEGGEVLLRTKERRDFGEEYEDIRIISTVDGNEVKLSEIADVLDEFEDVDELGSFDGKRAAMLKVFRVGEQAPIEISKLVNNYVARKAQELPSSIKITVWNDHSELLKSRLNLLLKNAYIGITLVFLILGIFLEIKLAFWVTCGIPISFLGALFLLPGLGVSINMISLFAFILSLGIVVDDAIIVGENIHDHMTSGKTRLASAIDGASEVAGPVVFSVLTSVAAFIPMFVVAGTMGKFIWVIPAIVIPVLLISLVESLYILPAHLAHSKALSPDDAIFGGLERKRLQFVTFLNDFIDKRYKPLLAKAIENKYLSLSIGFVFLLITFGLLKGGHLKFVNLPAVDGEIVSATLEMPVGTSVSDTSKVVARIYEGARKVALDYDSTRSGEKSVVRNVFSLVGREQNFSPHGGGRADGGAHLASITAFLAPSDERGFPATEFSKRWRQAVGDISGVKSISYMSDFVNAQEDINIQLGHESFDILRIASKRLQGALDGFEGVSDTRDNFAVGKKELKFKIGPEARSLGITEAQLGRQVRSAFYGAEALRLQRGRNELKVMVRYPKALREQLSSLEFMRIRTPEKGEVALVEVAKIEESEGYSVVRRANRKRVVNVLASADYAVANPSQVISLLESGELRQLMDDYPGLTYSLEGREQDRRDSNESLFRGFYFALIVIYALLAVPFKSYIQPIIVMFAIPFGFVGAALGHLILGHDVSLLSMCGFVALTGVVVNDSLILVDYINKLRREGVELVDAIIQGGCRRFRPIVLTSLTTFFGLTPIIFETSFQAQFLVPMAISLGFGILFATGITLFLVPVFYLMLEGVRKKAIG